MTKHYQYWLGGLLLTVTSLAQAAPEASPLRVAVTFTVLGDLVEQVAGDDAEVSQLTPINAEVHDWELTPGNFSAIERADIIFYNGYQLEQWMGQVESAARDGVLLVGVAEASGYPTRGIVTGELSGDTDPHLWMDPRAASAYVEVIADALAEARPSSADGFNSRAEVLQEELETLHDEITETLSAIPDEQRFLLTSEAAFIYFAEAYNFEHTGIWGNNAESAGAPRQLMEVIDLVMERQPEAIFWESTISDRHVSSIARDTGVEAAGPLYVDSLGETDGPASSYIDMMRHNAELLREHLAVDSDT
ncbi:zinc ABC transporter substrate-binding protein [Halomonas sp. CH40]